MNFLTVRNQSENILTLFCLIDDLCKSLFGPETYTTGRRAKLSRSELITLLVIFSLNGQNTFHGFYRIFVMNKYFTNLPEYSRLLRNIKTISYETHILLQALLLVNRQHHNEQLMLIDSAPLPVCRNKRIFNYTVTELADRGMSSMGWFFGFKVHIIVTTEGTLLQFMVTPGNTSDKDHNLLIKMFDGLKGIAVGDKAYVSYPLKEKLMKEGINLITGMFKNTKKIVTNTYHSMLRLRQLVETSIGSIKFRSNCASSLPRSLDGYFWRYISAIFSYVLTNQYL